MVLALKRIGDKVFPYKAAIPIVFFNNPASAARCEMIVIGIAGT